MKFAFLSCAAFVASTYAAVTRTGGTISLKDNKGAIGNECITFRNNGEIVEAACVTTAVDRQITPGRTDAGVDVLFVERGFGAAQAAVLVGREPCIGFNGTHFLTQDCNTLSAPVTLVNGQLVAGQACSNGVSRISELTVSLDGSNCATFTSTTVPRTLDNAGTPAPVDNTIPVASPITTSTAPTATAAPVNPPPATPPVTGSNGAVTRLGATVVLADTNAANRGNECITFRNNGEIVEAACVNTAVDRQITPGKTAAGVDVLFVERSFGAAQAARLVGKQPCIGFNGTHFIADDCNTITTPVTFVNGQLVAGNACSNGINAISELSVSIDGTNCATFTPTNVQRTLDNAGTPATTVVTQATPATGAGPATGRPGRFRNGRVRQRSGIRRSQPHRIASFARSRLHAARRR